MAREEPDAARRHRCTAQRRPGGDAARRAPEHDPIWTDAGRLTAYRINARGDRRFRRGDVERILVEDAPTATPMATHGVSGRAGRSPSSPSSSAWRQGLGVRSPAHIRSGARHRRGAAHRDRTSSARRSTCWRDERLELLAHAGFPIAPVGVSPAPPPNRCQSQPTVAIALAARHGPIGFLILDAPSADRMPPVAFMRSLACDHGHRPRPAPGSSSVPVGRSVAHGRCAPSPRS